MATTPTTTTSMPATMITTMVEPTIMSTTITLPSLLQDGIRYGTIFADPPWPERGGGKIKRGADRHYPLMDVPDIIGMAHAVRQFAKPRSHLYLWTTNNHLPSALLVMWAWGFEYKTALTWMKTGNPGMGQYHQGLTEHLLFGVRGKPRKYRTLNGKRARGLTGFFQESRGRHSKKPDIVYKWARQVSYGPYLELFGIGERPGWTVWGNQIWEE